MIELSEGYFKQTSVCLQATDADSKPFNALTYSLQGGDEM